MIYYIVYMVSVWFLYNTWQNTVHCIIRLKIRWFKPVFFAVLSQIDNKHHICVPKCFLEYFKHLSHQKSNYDNFNSTLKLFFTRENPLSTYSRSVRTRVMCREKIFRLFSFHTQAVISQVSLWDETTHTHFDDSRSSWFHF